MTFWTWCAACGKGCKPERPNCASGHLCWQGRWSLITWAPRQGLYRVSLEDLWVSWIGLWLCLYHSTNSFSCALWSTRSPLFSDLLFATPLGYCPLSKVLYGAWESKAGKLLNLADSILCCWCSFHPSSPAQQDLIAAQAPLVVLSVSVLAHFLSATLLQPKKVASLECSH